MDRDAKSIAKSVNNKKEKTYHESRLKKKHNTSLLTLGIQLKKDRNFAIREKVSGLICLFCLGVSATNQSYCTDLYGISSA